MSFERARNRLANKGIYVRKVVNVKCGLTKSWFWPMTTFGIQNLFRLRNYSIDFAIKWLPLTDVYIIRLDNRKHCVQSNCKNWRISGRVECNCIFPCHTKRQKKQRKSKKPRASIDSPSCKFCTVSWLLLLK